MPKPANPKTVMPSTRLREYAGDQGCDEGTGVEGCIINLKGGFAAAVITGVKVAQLRCQVAAQYACTHDEQEQRCEK